MSKISCVPLQLALVLALEEDQGQGPYRYPLMRPCWLDEHCLLSAVVARTVMAKGQQYYNGTILINKI